MERVSHVEGEDLPLMGRPQANGVLLTQTEVSAASLQIFERGSTTPVHTRTLLTSNTPTGAAQSACSSPSRKERLGPKRAA